MSGVVYRYLMIVVACLSLLAGLQIPGFVDQYQKRLDAHLREVSVNLQPFQAIADKYFNGDIGKLIELHRASAERAFQEEAVAIEKMVARKLRFETEMAALNTSLPLQALHILLHGDREILGEAKAQYSFAVPLNRDALVFGASVAVSVLLLAEILFALLRLLVRRISGPNASAQTP